MGRDEVLAGAPAALPCTTESHDCSVSLIEVVGLGSIMGLT